MRQEDNYWLRTYSRRLSRRRFVGASTAAAAGAATLSLVGCGDDDDDDGSSSTPTEAGSPTTAPTRGGTLNLPGKKTSEPYDPATGGGTVAPLWEMIGEGPLWLNDKTYTVEGAMFSEWETPSDDEVVLTLREGMTWQDLPPVSGRAITADDAAKGLAFMAGLSEAPGYEDATFHRKGNFLGMLSATASDDATVVLSMGQPSSAIFYGMADFKVKLLPPEQIEMGFADSNKLIGSGPFMIQPGFANGQEYGSPYTVSRNPNYRIPDRPYLDQVSVKYIVDPAAQDSAIVAGSIDALSLINRPAVQVDALQSQTSDFKLVSWEYPYWHWLAFNLQRPVWQDQRVRKAIQLALDYESMGDGFYGAYWKYTGSLPPSYRADAIQSAEIRSMPGYNPDTKEADRAEARRLLDDAGYPDGEGLTPVSFGYRGPHYANAVRAKDQLESVFTSMRIELATTDDSAAREARLAAGDFDWAFYGTVPVPDATLQLVSAYSTAGGRNYPFYENAQVDQLLTQALADLTAESRSATLLQVQNILNDELPYIPLHTADQSALVRNNVLGFEGDNRPGPGTPDPSLERYAQYLTKVSG